MHHELTPQDLGKVGQQPEGLVSVQEVLTYLESDRFFDKKDLAEYLTISTRTIEEHLAEIPYYRLFNSKLIFKKSEIDEWVAQYREQKATLDRIVDEAIESLAR